MDDEQFEWDYENISHIARHGVTPEEAEDVLLGASKEVGMREEGGEMRVSEMGFTRAGRLLLVASTPRNNKTRVITAFEPGARLRLWYFSPRRTQ